MFRRSKQKKKVARENHCAFWDFYAAMGGRSSILSWIDQGMVKADNIHFRPRFHKIMWGRLTKVLLQSYLLFLEDKGFHCTLSNK